MKHIVYYLQRLYSFSGSRVYLNLIAMAFISVLEGFAILLLIPLINSIEVVSLNTGAIPMLQLFDFLNEMPLIGRLSVILSMYVLLVAGQNLLYRSMTLQQSRFQQSFSQELRAEAYRSLLQANWSYFIKHRKSDLVNIMTIELARVIAGINFVLAFFRSIIFTLVQLGIAFWLAPAMTLFVLLCGGLLALAMKSYIRRSQRLGHKTSELAQAYLAGITDQLNGIKEIKSNTLEKSRMQWLYSITAGMIQEQLEYVNLRTSSQVLHKTASAILIALFLFISILAFRSHPEQLILIMAIFSRLWPRFSEMQSSMQQIASTIPAFESLARLNQESMEVREGTLVEDVIAPLQVHDAVMCKGVCFRYNPKDTEYALNKITLRIPANQMTAIVGRSGAGKTTLIDVVMGMLRPEKGEVSIDGVPLTETNLMAWRNAISYVPQDPYVFNASIRENLTMVAPDASEEEMWEALQFSSATQFVEKLPQGLDTVIGDRGIRLSGGERQRLVLARAILRKPSVLILDEATSALDTENEARIQEALHKLKGTITIIVIAHRLSTIREADQVIVLDQGNVVQEGLFNQLAKSKAGVFNKLLNNQIPS